jgi:hypothetical protein
MSTLRALLPKEHGAYGQVTFPLATVFALAEPSRPAYCLLPQSSQVFWHTNLPQSCSVCVARAHGGNSHRPLFDGSSCVWVRAVLQR